MLDKTPLIGFDRYVDIDWCRSAFDVALTIKSIDELKEQVAEVLPGIESQRKTLDILKRISTKPFDHLDDFVSRGLAIYRVEKDSSVLPVAWGAAIASYSFFGKTAETTGRLLSLQGDCTIKEVQRRMAEQYGDRSGVERAVNRVLQSQASWSALARDDVTKRVRNKDSTSVESEALTAWLIEAAVRYLGKAISISSLKSVPVLFPFTLSRSLNYVISNCPSLDIRTEGPNNQFVALRAPIGSKR